MAEGELCPHLTQCGQGRGLPHAKFHLDLSNRLATIHQRHRQTDRQDRTTVRLHRANRFTNGRPKIRLSASSSHFLPPRTRPSITGPRISAVLSNTHVTSVGLMSPNSAKQARFGSHVDRNSTGNLAKHLMDDGRRILHVDSYWHHCDMRHATACIGRYATEHCPDATCNLSFVDYVLPTDCCV